MRRPSLLATNPYLAEPAKRRRMFEDSVITSSAVEGVRLTRRELRQQTRADEARVASRPHKAKIAWFNSKPRNQPSIPEEEEAAMNEQQERAALEAAHVLAKTARVFFLEAMAQGFAEEQAFRLTQAWLAALCGPRTSA